MIQAGVYLATVLTHSINETKKGEPQVVIAFSFKDRIGPQKITYYGSFSEKAAQYTIKNLITCGLKGSNPAGEIEIGKEVEIVVDLEKDDQGKDRAKVKFINKVGGSRPPMDKSLAIAKLSSLEGMVAKLRAENPNLSDDEIPF